MADTVVPPITAAPGNPTSTAPTSTTGVDKSTIAGNFQTFLTLLTTQLKNQNPLDPLDTNQLKSNDQLATLVSLEKTAQATTALAYVGQTVAVDGQTAALKNNQATWSFSVPKPVSAVVTIKNATGQSVYTSSYTMNAGTQNFNWDGRDTTGVQWPDGNYTLSVTAKDASGQVVSIPSEVQGVVDSVDLTQTPAVLSIGGQTFTLDKIKRVVRPGA
jgi:flagellar basal-body rod modification protein FlgD